MERLEQGEFVWLKGSGHSGNAYGVRSGHLIYLPDQDDYCVVVVDDRRRLAITVLTEEMGLNSSWANGITGAAKLKAKRISLGNEVVPDSHVLRLYAEEREGLSLTVRARTFTYDWVAKIVNLQKITVTPEQIDPEADHCTLSELQEAQVKEQIHLKVSEQIIRPYGELFVATGKGKQTAVSNKFEGFESVTLAEQAMRWSEHIY